MAKIIAAQTGADIQEVLTETPYTQNYNTVVNQAQKEIREGYLPPIKKLNFDLSKYDVVYLGTPIWWGTMGYLWPRLPAPPAERLLRAVPAF